MITEEEKAIAQPMLDTFNNLALVEGTYRKERRVFVCQFHKNKDGSACFHPLFMLVSEDMIAEADGPDGARTVVDENHLH